MVKKTKWSGVGEELSPDTAFIQAACALDVAGFLAEENRDVKGMIDVAVAYIAMGQRLAGGFEDEDEDEKGFKFGFVTEAESTEVIEVEPIEDDLEGEEDGTQD